MQCPNCHGQNLYIVDARGTKNGIGYRRRRECADCGARFTTYEVTKEEYSLIAKSAKILKEVQNLLGKCERNIEKSTDQILSKKDLVRLSGVRIVPYISEKERDQPVRQMPTES